MSGDHRLDTAKLGNVLGEKVGRADADFVRTATGFAIGGVPPLGECCKRRFDQVDLPARVGPEPPGAGPAGLDGQHHVVEHAHVEHEARDLE